MLDLLCTYFLKWGKTEIIWKGIDNRLVACTARRENILKWLGQGGMPRCYWIATKGCLPKGEVSKFFNFLLYLLRANVLNTRFERTD